jgi:membrane fusion protein (multidrug efflux system)
MSLAALAIVIGLYLGRTSPGAQASRDRAAREAEALSEVASPRVAALGAIEIATNRVQSRSLPLRAELTAVLGPARRVSVAAEVSGQIVEVPVDEHARVEAGATLVQIERSLLEAAEGRARAVLQRARANYELSRLDLDRQRGLKERNVTSPAEFDRAQATERAGLADLREAQAALQDARVRLDKATIRAPFGGVVTRFDLEPGAYLRPGDHVADVLDTSEIEVEVGVTDRQIVALRVGAPVAVSVDVYPEEIFGGVVRALAQSADDVTQRYAVEVRVPNLEGRLLPGMLGRVRFDLGHREPAIRVPRAATQKEFEIEYVFVVNGGAEQPAVERRRVTTRAVPFRPDLVEVTGGLEAGETIAVTRVRELRDGLRVRVRSEDP